MSLARSYRHSNATDAIQAAWIIGIAGIMVGSLQAFHFRTRNTRNAVKHANYQTINLTGKKSGEHLGG